MLYIKRYQYDPAAVNMCFQLAGVIIMDLLKELVGEDNWSEQVNSELDLFISMQKRLLLTCAQCR